MLMTLFNKFILSSIIVYLLMIYIFPIYHELQISEKAMLSDIFLNL